MNKKLLLLALSAFLVGNIFSTTYAQTLTNPKATTTSTNIAIKNATQPDQSLKRDLYRGLAGDDVKVLQTWLAQDKNIYPLGLVTGYFGPATQTAVQKFQSINKIVTSGSEATTGFGKVGPKTRLILTSQFSNKKAPIAPITTATTTQTIVAPTPTILSSIGSSISKYVNNFNSGFSQAVGSNQVIVVSNSIHHPDPSYPMPPHGEEVVYSVSTDSTSAVKFTSVDINPLVVYPGDTQTLKVIISSTNSVSSVKAVTVLDNKTITLDLVNDGTGTNTWTTFWIVSDTHVNVYKTVFTAIDSAGNTGTTNFDWSDPCTGFVDGQDSTLGANCTMSVTDGVDGGNLIIPAGKSITLNSGASLVFNQGKTITKYGAISLAKGATIKKGYLFYVDTDNDGYTPSKITKTFSASAAVSGFVRAATAPAMLDPNDNNPAIFQTLNCYVDADGDTYTVGGLVGVSSGASCPSGYRATSPGTDCDDTNVNIYPGTTRTKYQSTSVACGASCSTVQETQTCQTSGSWTGTYTNASCSAAAPSYTVGSSCNPNSCGTYGGTINNACTGACSGGVPATPYTVGGACASAANSCGSTGSGTYTDACTGACNASVPATPYTVGGACTSAANSCGSTGSGTYTNACSGACNASTPATPYTVGGACTSVANACGTTGSGTYTNACSGACNASTPATPYTIGATCNACGTITNQCTGTCSVGSPSQCHACSSPGYCVADPTCAVGTCEATGWCSIGTQCPF